MHAGVNCKDMSAATTVDQRVMQLQEKADTTSDTNIINRFGIADQLFLSSQQERIMMVFQDLQCMYTVHTHMVYSCNLYINNMSSLHSLTFFENVILCFSLWC